MPLQPLLKPMKFRFYFFVFSRVSKADVNSSESYPTSLLAYFLKTSFSKIKGRSCVGLRPLME